MEENIEKIIKIEGSFDEKDGRLLAALQQNARLSFSALGRRVGLSAPAVAERVRRMEQSGLISGYRAVVDPARAGRPVTAFLRLLCPGDRYNAVRRLARELPAVLECHHVTGEDCFLLKVAVPSLAELDRIVERFRRLGRTVPAVVLSSAVESKEIAPPDRRK